MTRHDLEPYGDVTCPHDGTQVLTGCDEDSGGNHRADPYCPTCGWTPED